MQLNKKKILFLYLLFLPMLNGCVASSQALLAPLLTGASTGNTYQAGFSYVSNSIIKENFGKTPTEYVTSIIIKNSGRNKPITEKNKKKKIKNKESAINLKNSNKDYNEFIVAVKNLLK